MPASPDFPYDVFLSHSAKDKAVVRPLAERLRADGVKVWFDEWVLKPGDSNEKNQAKTAKIEEGLERPRVLVFCMSAQEFGSDWAQWESGTLRTGQRPFRDPLNKERRFLPLRLPGQFFYNTQIPVCLWLLAKNKHDGCDVENELALAVMNLALLGIEADFGPGHADTFGRDLARN